MRAYRVMAWGEPPRFDDVPVPEPGPGEVLVRVGGSGLCHSDLHVLDAGLLPWPVPFTLGHEPAGWVEAIGAGVTAVEPGEAVIVYGPLGCGTCRRCREGSVNHCERTQLTDPAALGLGRDGGHAEYLLVPSSDAVVPIPGLDPVEAAPLADAALTPYHAVKRSLHVLRPGSVAVVIGVGGLGHMAIQIVRALAPSVRVVAVDSAPDKLEHARSLDVDEALLAGPTVADTVKTIGGGRGADLVVDCVGSPDTTAAAAQMGTVGGHIAIVGLAGGSVPVGLLTTKWECWVSTSYWGSSVELLEVVELARMGAIRVQVERFALDRADEAYDRMRSGTLRGRAVLVP